MKFGTLHRILNPVTVTWPKIAICEIQDGGGRHLKIVFFGHYSLSDWPISANFVWKSRTACWQRLRYKNMQMCKTEGGGRPPFWKSLNRHISVKNCQIVMKFGALHQILNPVTVTWPKIAIFEIQDDVITNPRWRTAVILKIAKSPYLSEKSSDFDQIWYTTADIEPNTFFSALTTLFTRK